MELRKTKRKEKFLTLLTLEEKKSLVSFVEKEIGRRKETCVAPTIENLDFFSEEFLLEAIENQESKYSDLFRKKFDFENPGIYDDEFCKVCTKPEDCPFLLPNPTAKNCLRKYPRTLEELLEACRKPAKHKQMRRWHYFGLDLGPKMTEEQLSFQDELRAKVKRGEVTVEKAHEIWREKYPEVS
jgi:hypothetical protein